MKDATGRDVGLIHRRFGRWSNFPSDEANANAYVELGPFPTMEEAFCPRQLQSLQTRIGSRRWYIDEQLWTFLASSLIADSPERQIPLFCGEALTFAEGCGIACEAEPISTRSGSKEGNTVLDIACGHVGSRSLPTRGDAASANTLAGITYSPVADDSWVCFVEAKILSDASGSVTNDPLRNQLTRVIENLLCFQSGGKYPHRLHFALLTPRLLRDNPKARLYGYKMHEYHEREAILKDIEACDFPWRCTTGYSFPELRPRVEALAPLRWVTFEEGLSAAGLGDDLDVVRRPNELAHVQATIISKLDARLATPLPPEKLEPGNTKNATTPFRAIRAG